MKPFLALFLLLVLVCCTEKQPSEHSDFLTHFEKSGGTETSSYLQVIDFYLRLAKEYQGINVQTVGTTDSGRPLHVVTFNPEGNFNFQKLAQDKTVIFINNGIHPGESDGIDASMMLFRDFATAKLKAPENSVLVTIPVYNIGGALYRNSNTRVNQNGPKTYGFRGNARNYDLNRDFIKNDSRNARTFTSIFHQLKPDIFVDTHVSNGADYQYTLTHLFTQQDKLGSVLGSYLHNQFRPELEAQLRESGWDITPYVNVFNRPPDDGFIQFMDYPRYSTGYTSLWHTLGLMVETHMLKPYKDRVQGTYALLYELALLADKEHATIKSLRQQSREADLNRTYYPLGWKLDSTQSRTLNFKGYRADTIPSEISGLPRLKYNRTEPFQKPVTYFDHYTPADSVLIPEAYVIPASYTRVRELLDLNHIQYSIIQGDSLRLAEIYRIEKYETLPYVYEGHYLHRNTEVSVGVEDVVLKQGDLWVPTRQQGLRYLMETLEPAATDSFFNWNFFDTILQRKEGISPYVFEDIAVSLLEKRPELKTELLKKQAEDADFAGDHLAQLQWLYEKSEHAEDAYMRYPVYRIPGKGM